MLHADQDLDRDQKKDALGLMDFCGQAIDEGEPHNYKEEEKRNDKEGEDRQAGFLARGDTRLEGGLQGCYQVLHMSRNNEPLNIEEL